MTNHRLFALLVLAALALGVLGLLAGSEGWSLLSLHEPGAQAVLWQIRAPRTLGAWLTGALLGVGGALAQGLFRNPLADPYLLGTSAGAGLGVALVLAATSAAVGDGALQLLAAGLGERLGLAGAAFAGALVGVGLTLLLARGTPGAGSSSGLLLCGVVVGVVLGALSDLLTFAAPQALRGKQLFVLGSTGFLGWSSCAVLALALTLTLPAARRLSRALDALALGDDTATSLGLPLARVRALLVVLLALATGAAVSQTGLIAFVGLVAPHLARRAARGAHGALLLASAGTGGALLLASDVLARSIVAPEEWPVGVLTAVLGGGYLLWRLRGRGS